MVKRTNDLLTFIAVMLCIITVNVVIFDIAMVYVMAKVMNALAKYQIGEAIR